MTKRADLNLSFRHPHSVEGISVFAHSFYSN